MWIIYRNGTFGYYIEAMTDNAYRWRVGTFAWEGNWPSECCLFIPLTDV